MTEYKEKKTRFQFRRYGFSIVFIVNDENNERKAV